MAATGSDNKGKRALSKERRRQQLIDATIRGISRKGLTGLTLADVAREAGLSQGIVNLHFDSKDNLLNETLGFLAEEYDAQFMSTLEAHAADAAAAVRALMELDLKPSICDRRKLAVWFAFWGQVKTVPTYQKICAAYNARYVEIMRELCQRIIDEGGYRNVSAQVVTDVLSSMTDGLWLSCMINPKSFDRGQALEAVLSYLRAVFPEHYGQPAAA